MSILNHIRRLIYVSRDPQAVSGLLSWPTFSVDTYFMVAKLKRQGLVPQTVLDVGANEGQFALAVAKLFPRIQVHSFEPVPESFNKLRKNISKLPNVSVYPIALGDTEGEMVCHINSFSATSSILSLSKDLLDAFPDVREVGQVPISVSRLDTVFAEQTLESPVLLKLDVQGYEAHVLRGGQETLKQIQYVIVETSFKPLYQGETLFMDLVMLMQARGFQFLRPVGWLSAPKTGEVLQMDALFTRLG